MENLISKIKENKVEIVFAGIILIILLLLTIDFSEPEKTNESKEPVKKEEQKPKEVIVDVKGAVNKPGVYTLKNDKRVIDAINMAGGLTTNADTSLINLSMKLTDEMVIDIYTKEEMKDENMVCAPCECPEISDACITEKETTKEETAKNTKESNKKEVNTNQKVSINTGTLEELQTLDGIGETKAKAIIGYRETNGLFKKIEEIKNVSGIGDSTYEKIKGRIII